MTDKPYLVLSDIHAHAWSTFATVDKDGVNSRLRITMEEMERAANVLLEAGGDKIVFGGDLFHTRGAVDTEVLNYTSNVIRKIQKQGVRFICIPGNHDLKGVNTSELGNAFASFFDMERFTIYHKPSYVQFIDRTRLAFVPWQNTTAQLLVQIETLLTEMTSNGQDPSNYDLFIHAGIDGVVSGLPDHGLTAAKLAVFNFKRVFAGHYHNHKIMEGGRVISIGATTHQTFSDVGSKAGFLLVYPDVVEYNASNAPRFVDIDSSTPDDDIELIAQGNYVRVRGFKFNDAEASEFRQALIDFGAKGISIQTARDVVTARTSTTTGKTMTLAESVEGYIKEQKFTNEARIKAQCDDILTKVASAGA